jgi:hypothetical protein
VISHVSMELVSSVSETVSKILEINFIFMWLVTQKDFTAFGCGEKFQIVFIFIYSAISFLLRTFGTVFEG